MEDLKKTETTEEATTEQSVNPEVTNPVEPGKKKKLILAKDRAQAIWAVVIFGTFILLSLYNTVNYIQSEKEAKAEAPQMMNGPVAPFMQQMMPAKK